MKRIIIFLCVVFFLASCAEQTRFERLDATQTGIDFTNTITESDSFNILNNEYMYNGGGVGVGDFNNDGLQDLVFTGNQVSTRLYLNQGDLRFKDITANLQQLDAAKWHSGVTVADINADGRLDFYLTATTSDDPRERRNELWVHQGLNDDGEPHFLEMAGQYGIADEGYSVHAAFLDYDQDGDLDLYVLNNIVGKDVPTNYRAKMVDGSSPNNDSFYRNEGNGRFVNVTKEAGIVIEGFGLGLAVGDVNKDNYPDVYVSNDYISNDLLYINQQDGTFKNYSEDYLSYHSKFSMGNDMSDINNDGYPDVMTLDMLPEQYFRKKQTINGNSYYFYVNDWKFGYEHQYVRNMVHLHNGFRNDEMLPFSEIGQLMGVFETEWSWSPLFADYDNDGDRDLLITNGFPKDLTDKDFTNYKVKVHGHLAGDREVIKRIPVVKVSNYAYENLGDFRFEDRTEAWGMKIPSFSNGASFVDLDNDGDLDYIVNNIDDEAFVYKNTTIEKQKDNAHFLRVRLEGKAPNTLALGATVELWSGGQYQFYEHFLTRGYISSVEPVVHFGLNGHQTIDSLKVTWPHSRKVTLMQSVEPNQLITVSEQEASPALVTGVPDKNEPLLFEPRNELIDYQHTQEDYIDFFQSQRIIPHKFSQIGPCMAKGDIDGDGSEDLLIGASKELPARVFLRKGDHFENAAFPGLTDTRECTESDLIVMDIDGDGDNDVVALSGGYINQNPEDYRHYVFMNEGGIFNKIPLPLPAFPASIVRPFDFDHDGDMDLFVGARVKKEGFPYAGESFLLVNEGGVFTSDGATGFDLGMVTDAVWSDYNGDGWEDLLIAREWNSVAVLQNQEGQQFSPVETDLLNSKQGFWSAVVAGDFDGDGDDDYILGNLGENHRFHIGKEWPMRLYAIDLDDNGVIDPVITSYWKDETGVMQEYPVNYLDELGAQSPFFRKMFTSYTRFSYTEIDSIIDKSSVTEDQLFSVNTTASYILWNENGTFEWEKLPRRLQVAPIKEILVRDFNSDGRLDALTAGNDYTYDVSTGFYDANKGMLLIGKGDRTFQILSPAESGLLLQGQVESLLFFEGESSFLVAGMNRDSVRVYQHAARNLVN